MRVTGIILILIGIAMLIFTGGINFQTKKKVVDAGPIQIDKKENKHVGWPAYAGGVIVVAGIVVLLAGGKRKGSA
ncbi:hypothetical protein [Compostibacter hankyongensis]|uniref:DUF3185 domain-containing protein n=1 Tax=Compostibacter hankyongensis TaxID=1007089 RepID=A0ABP8FEF7_9BACT